MSTAVMGVSIEDAVIARENLSRASRNYNAHMIELASIKRRLGREGQSEGETLSFGKREKLEYRLMVLETRVIPRLVSTMASLSHIT